jgi:uncharacterized protein
MCRGSRVALAGASRGVVSESRVQDFARRLFFIAASFRRGLEARDDNEHALNHQHSWKCLGRCPGGDHDKVGRVLIERIGFTPLKGGRHMSHDLADLTAGGPVGDRVFCLVDRSCGRVLRTVENRALLRGCAQWKAGVLSVDLQGRTLKGVPSRSDEMLMVDYWGRAAAVQVCTGPWAQAYSEHLGYDVVLARAVSAGEVVYGASVTLVTTASMRLLADRLGREVGSERFRSTFLVDTGDSAPHVEDSWVGRQLSVGAATVRVRAVVPRCAVVDLDPVTGRNDAPVLEELAGYRQSQGQINFGVDAVVTSPGRVRTGDPVVLEEA